MEYMAAQMDRQIEGAQLAYDAALADGQQPAFPVADYDNMTFQPATVEESKRQISGMTLRDYFAAKALSTVQAYGHEDVATWSPEDFAKHAYALADAMLAARAFLRTAQPQTLEVAMSDWKSWSRGDGRPSPAPGLIDVKCLDGKVFYRKPIQNCYWGADSLIEGWRPSLEPTE